MQRTSLDARALPKLISFLLSLDTYMTLKVYYMFLCLLVFHFGYLTCNTLLVTSQLDVIFLNIPFFNSYQWTRFISHKCPVLPINEEKRASTYPRSKNQSCWLLDIWKMFMCGWCWGILPSCGWTSLLSTHCKQLGLRSVPDALTCTSMPQRWNIPRGRKIEQKEIQDVLVKKPKIGANYSKFIKSTL